MGRISPGPTRWPPGAERRLVPAKSNLKPQTIPRPTHAHLHSQSSETPPKHPRAHLSPTKPPGTAQPGGARPGSPIHRRGRAGPQQPTQPTPPGPGAPPPHTDHHPQPRPPPSNPPRQAPEHFPGLVPPTRELDQAHRQRSPGPDHPRQRPAGDHRRPRTASPPTRPRPARLDPPHRVGPGPDTQHRHQRHMSRDHTPTPSPSREGPPGGRETTRSNEKQACAPTRNTALRAAGLRTPDDNLPPRTTDSDHPQPEVWCTVLEHGHYYVVAATATSPGPQWLVQGTDTMLAPGTAQPGAVGDPTTPHRVLRGVLQTGDKPPARALAQITSGQAGYHLGLAMLCLAQWIQRRWPSTGTVSWIWAITTAHTQIEADPDTRKEPPPDHSTTSPAGTMPSTGSSAAWALAQS